MHIFSQCIHFYFIDDPCQYWLNKTDGTLTSPNFGLNNQGEYQLYDHNSNCTWILNADQGYYVTLEIVDFMVNNNDIQMTFYSK